MIMKKEKQTNKVKRKMKQNKSSISNEKVIHFGLTDSIFDWDGLLYRLMGDEDLAKEIIDDFLKQIPDNLIAVKNALNKKDMMLVKREAHIIKGASGNVGALILQEIAEQIEIAGEEENLDKAILLFTELDTQLEVLKNKLAQLKV
jgi:HPt (histidine-containing phosphotransfer) domain-containing protein